MIAVLLFTILVTLIAAPTVAYFVVRAVLRGLEPGSVAAHSSPIDDRLTRIEEAIDAMAQQIERLTEQQRILLGAPPVREVVGEDDVPGRAEPR